MPWTSFLPENVRQHPEHFLGPYVAGVIVQTLETGILIGQSVPLWTSFIATVRPLRVYSPTRFCGECLVPANNVCGRKFWWNLISSQNTITFIWFQTVIAIYNTWRVVVVGFGDVVTVVDLGWADRIQPALNCVMAVPFQAFLIWRCWNVLQRRWIILAPLVSLLLANVVMNVYITIDIFFISSIGQLINGPPDSYITAFVLTAVLDIMITALMIWFLLRVKSQVISRRLARIIVRLHRMVWEAAVPPCACAIAACVTYITMSQENLWDVFLQSILGKLYVISLFVVLNGRADLKRSLPTSTQSTRMSRYWANDAPFQFRVDLTSVIDLQAHSDMGMTPTTDTPLHPNRDGHEQKAGLSPRDSTLPDFRRNGYSAAPSHEPFSFEIHGRAETSSFVMVTRPPTVLHRSIGRGDRRMSC